MRQKVVLRKAVKKTAAVPPLPFNELVATCAGGLEHLLVHEVELGGFSVTRRRAGAVAFRAGLTDVPALIRTVRTASRLLVQLERFQLETFDAVYHRLRSLPWELIIPLECTFAITATTRSPTLKDHRFLAMRVKDAIVDRQRRMCSGRRSSVDRKNPTFRVTVFADNSGGLDVSLDAADGPLHERGYRTEAGEAPLRETVAAAMLLQAGYHEAIRRGAPPILVDPFCGSGTIAIEAALMCAGGGPRVSTAPLPCEKWPWFPPVPREASRGDAPLLPPVDSGAPVRILASDSDEGIVQIARKNADRAGVSDRIRFSVGDMNEQLAAAAEWARRSSDSVREPMLVVTNPPYGERLDRPDLVELYRSLGESLREHVSGGTAHILCSEKSLIQATGMRVSRRVPMFNGGLECRLFQLNIY